MRAQAGKDHSLNSSKLNIPAKDGKGGIKIAKNDFSLDESESKFAQLRKKLREITKFSHINKQNTNSNISQMHLKQVRGSLDSVDAKVVQSKQIKSSSTAVQETERKKRNSTHHHLGSKPLKEVLVDNKRLLGQKQQTLGQINRLLELKQEYLSKIEHQLKRQIKQKYPKDRDYLQQTQKIAVDKVKAPNLYQIRQERLKLKEKPHQF